MITRKFSFPLAILIRQSDILYRALIDKEFAPAMNERLNLEGDTPKNNMATRFKKKLEALNKGDAVQSTKAGEAGDLTLQQKSALETLTLLTTNARRSARLAFPGQKVRLHKEFQVGVVLPRHVAAVLKRARLTLMSCQTHAAALKPHGWLPRDAEALAAALEGFDTNGLAKAGAVGDRVELTQEKTTAANAVFTDCLSIQNAARLEYLAGKPGNNAIRRRFLLGEFPPSTRPAVLIPLPPSEPSSPPVLTVLPAPAQPALPQS